MTSAELAAPVVPDAIGGEGAFLRRLVSIPRLALMAGVFAAVAPLTLPAAFVADLVRPRRWALSRLWLVAAGYLLGEVLGVLVLSAVWVATGFGRIAGARRRATYAVQAGWVASLCRAATAIYGWRWEVEGLACVRPGPVIVLIRHTSLLDTVIPTTFITWREGVRLRFVLKQELLGDPCLDLAGNWIPNVFVDRAAQDSGPARERIGALARGMGPDEGAIIYPEGTLFSPAKLARAQAKLAEEGSVHAVAAAALRNTLPPRPGGTLALLAGAPDCDVVVCAHEGLGGLGKVRDLTSGALVGRTIRISLRRFDRVDVPTDPEGQARWLFERWAEVDAWVGAQRVAGPATADA